MPTAPAWSTMAACRILFAPTTAHSIARQREDAERLGTMEMQDRTVVVTGGASGIGKETALLLAREGAHVFVGDVDQMGGRIGSSGETVYAAAKGGLIAFTKSLAREVARYHINVNCVCPGPTDTPLFQRQPERMREALTRAIPFRRIAQPHEIAEAVMFFLGPRSDYITGQVLSVSGGLTMVD